MLRLVLDTNVWLDWLVFAEPSVGPLRDAVAARRAQVYIDDACEAELVRVLAYDLGRHSIDAAAQAACLEACRRVALRIEAPKPPQVRLPQCRDPDDQKLLEAAFAARADYLVTKDLALLELSRRVATFLIVTPVEFGGAVVPLDPELSEAYKRAYYVVFRKQGLVLKIGEANPGLDALLDAADRRTAAFLTACNPRGKRLSNEENVDLQAKLRLTVNVGGYKFYEGEGRDPNALWPSEPSLLVVGISRKEAEEVGRTFEQNAIVFVEKGRAPELVNL